MELTSGRQTLASIDAALAEVRREVQEVDAGIQATSTELVALRQDEAKQYRRLAALRLDALIRGDLDAGLDEADHRVAETLRVRAAELVELAREVEASQRRELELEERRGQAAVRVEEAAAALDRGEAATQVTLAADAGYQAQLAKAQQADAVAVQAETKTQQAEQDRAEKGRPYESDRLFMYLWRRGYGTSKYDSGGLIRYLDGKVAELCEFAGARPNYAMLLEIPKRLREHAGRLRAVADEEFGALRALEEQAAAADGIPALRTTLEDAEGALAEADAAIEAEERRFRELMERRAAFAGGEDEHFKHAVERLVGEFERQGTGVLKYLAERTPTGEDDRVVRALIEIDAEEAELEQALTEHKRLHRRNLERLEEFEALRHRFKRARYDDSRSGFTNGALLALLLNQLLRGTASADDVWGTIRRNQRYRPMEADPGFGSGGFGRPGGVWRMPPLGGGRRGGFGGGRGGFRTGGGF